MLAFSYGDINTNMQKITFSIARLRLLSKLALALTLFSGLAFAFSAPTYAAPVSELITPVYDVNRATPSEEYVIGIYPYTTLAAFVANFSNSPSEIEVFDETGLIQITDPTDIIATGMTINLVIGSTVEDTLTIVVRGDVDGDTVITSADVVHIKKYITSIEIPDPYQFLASELIYDGALTSADPTILSEYISGLVTADAFNFRLGLAPAIIYVSPSSSYGGVTVDITGNNFTNISAITVGGIDCINFSIINTTTATCVLPSNTAGAKVVVMISSIYGSSNRNMTVNYISTTPTPTITAPTAGQILPAGTTSTAVTATTDVNVNYCYFGTTPSPTTTMITTGIRTYAGTLTGLTDGTTNTIYARCLEWGPYSPDVSTTFYIRSTTPATPTLTPANGATVNNGTTAIAVTSATPGSTCTWGTTALTATANASGTNHTTTTGTNTLYYSCVAGSGVTQSETTTGSWSFTGKVPGAQPGDDIQSVTQSTCPTTMTRVKDARDNRSYWIQRMDDGKCWMLTNLAYAGGGTNTYSDTVALVSGGWDFSGFSAIYNIPTGANPTTEPTNPSTSTSGIGQYGYSYSWCAAMGGQANACNDTSTSGFNTDISVCPANWRLPTGGLAGELKDLNTAINNGSTTSDAGLRTKWLGMYGGQFQGLFVNLGINGHYWSSTVYDVVPAGAAMVMTMRSSYVAQNYYGKSDGASVRCVLK